MAQWDRMILLTGATGLLGRYLLRDLLLQGRSVAVLVRDGDDGRAADRIAGLLDSWGGLPGRRRPGPIVLAGDLLEPGLGLGAADRRRLAVGCDGVIHAAASLKFRAGARGEPYATNVVGTGHLVDLCRRVGIPAIHHVSTAFVCGRVDGPVLEDEHGAEPSFRNAYEESKSEAEALVRGAAGMVATVYRPSVIVGDRETGYTSTYYGIYRFIEMAARLAGRAPAGGGEHRGSPRRLALRLPLTGDEARDLVPVDWVSRAIVELVDRPEWHGRTFHLTATRPVPAGVIKQVTEEVLGIEGMQLGGPGVFDDPTPVERAFLDHVRDYWPYLGDDPRFDRRNLEAALPGLASISVDRPMLERLIRFGVADGWGRGPAPANRPGVDPGRLDCRHYIEEVLPDAMGRSRVARAAGLDLVVVFQIVGPGGGVWTCEWVGGVMVSVRVGADDGAAIRYRTDPSTFDDIIRRRRTPQEAFFAREVEVEGDLEKALKLAVLFGHFLAEIPYEPSINREATREVPVLA